MNCSIYWNRFDEPLKFNNNVELGEKMDKLIYKKGKPAPENNSYIVDPVCGKLCIKVRKTNIPDLAEPKFTFDFMFDNLCGILTEVQLIQCIKMLEWISKHKVREKYRMFRPFGITIKKDPMAHWNFVLQSQFRDLRRKRYSWSLDALNKRRKSRLEYMDLWQQFILKKKVKNYLIL